MHSSLSDISAGLFTLIVTVVFYSQSGELEGVGRDYPTLLLILMFFGGMIMLVQGLVKSWRENGSQKTGEAVALHRIALISATSIAYAACIPLLGFYISSAAFMAVSSMLLNDGRQGKKIISAGVFALIMCLAVWLVFRLLLSVPTPEGGFF